MIFPDEKMIEDKAEEYSGEHLITVPSNMHGNPSARAALRMGYLAGWAECENHIKSAASEGFEEAWQSCGYEPSRVCNSHSVNAFKEGFEVAVISTAAKYEEKLREKDAEIRAWGNIGDEYSKLIDHCTNGLLSKANLPASTVISVMEEKRIEPMIEKLQAENEHLKAVLRELHEAYNHVSQPIEFLNVLKVLHKHDDLITKINKGNE